MRRAEKEITNINEIEKIIARALVCRIALIDNGVPYIVPLCFGYKNNTLYFHSALTGKKIDIIHKTGVVCFECESDIQLVSGVKGCDWTMKFASVIGWGKISLVSDEQEKINALDIIMKHYSDADSFEYSPKSLALTQMIKIDIDEMTGKKSA